MVNNLPAMQVTWVQSLGWEDPLEEGVATHSDILAWRIQILMERGALQQPHSLGSQRVGHDRVTEQIYRKILLSFFIKCLPKFFCI